MVLLSRGRGRRGVLQAVLRSAILVLATALLLAGCLPFGFAERTTQQALVLPTSMAFAADGRLFVTEKRGTIQTYDSVDDATPQQFADLRQQVQSIEDHGLLAVEVDRQWPTRPYIYILYSYDAPLGGTAPTYSDGTDNDPCPLLDCPSQARVARLTAGADMKMTELKVLVQDVCLPFFYHGGGGLRQDSDGSLVAAFGEGSLNTPDGFVWGQTDWCKDPPGEGGHMVSQDIRTPADPTGLSGSIVRIDPDTGAAWPTNPGIGLADLNARKIIGYGARNPYRLTIRPGTHEVYIADVGSTYAEEINRIMPGQIPNFGWPCFEGTQVQPDTATLRHPLCTSLTLPQQTAPFHRYCHVDLGNGQCGIGSGAISAVEFYTGDSYGAQYKGALFFADYTRNTIWAMLPTNGVPDPTKIETFATELGGPVDLRSGPNGDLFYVDIFKGTIQRLYKGDPPPIDTSRPKAVIDSPADGYAYTVGQQITFSGHGTDAAGNPLPASALRWDLVVLHCTAPTSCHRHYSTSQSGVSSGSFLALDHEQPSHLEIALTVTSNGKTDVTTVDLPRRAAAALGPVAAQPVVPSGAFLN